MGKSKGVCKRASLSACAGKAEEGAVAEPRRLTTTQSSVRDERGAACSPLDLRIWDLAAHPALPGERCHSLRATSPVLAPGAPLLMSSPAGLMSAYGDIRNPLVWTITRLVPCAGPT